jgi:hypothetical protein
VLVHSFAEGQDVTLTALRKGVETKLTARLQARSKTDVHHHGGENASEDHNEFHFDWNGHDNEELAAQIRDTVERSRDQAREATARAKEEMERALATLRQRNPGNTGSKLDLDGAQIILRDASGKIEIRQQRGKRTATIKDGQGKVVFDGPIDTPEQRKAIPADQLAGMEKLEREQSITFSKGDADSTGGDGKADAEEVY